MVTFACEECGVEVAVEVRRAHRFCAVCASSRRYEEGRRFLKRDNEGRNALVSLDLEAVARVDAMLGVSGRNDCGACGKPLTPKKRQGGLSKKWCDEKCRQRALRHGVHGGYAGALLADPCSYCGGPGGHFDHVEASSRGGGNTWENLAGACGSCNARKGQTPLLNFLLARPLYEQIEACKRELAQVV